MSEGRGAVIVWEREEGEGQGAKRNGGESDQLEFK